MNSSGKSKVSLKTVDLLQEFIDFYRKPLNSLRNLSIFIEHLRFTAGIHRFVLKTFEFLEEFINFSMEKYSFFENSLEFASGNGGRDCCSEPTFHMRVRMTVVKLTPENDS